MCGPCYRGVDAPSPVGIVDAVTYSVLRKHSSDCILYGRAR
eukprot:XP_001704848.1 Hypothetical protein GL50803_35075 [Giardia lamblia ATCC 50803]